MKEKNSYIGGLIRRHFSADRYEDNHDRILPTKDYRTISGKPLDIETLRPFPWHADHAP